jgi:hypothetical protein
VTVVVGDALAGAGSGAAFGSSAEDAVVLPVRMVHAVGVAVCVLEVLAAAATATPSTPHATCGAAAT